MTTRQRRSWLITLADREILSALLTASRDCMTDACDDEPDDCSHAVNRMTPLEFAEWVEGQVRRSEREGDSAMTREHKEAGARRRWRAPARQLEAIAV